MIALLGSVLGASLVGSLHCAAMCGPLQGLYLDPTHAARARWTGPLAHALGRLGAYVTLGALAGGVGAVVEVAGRLAAIQRAAMIVAASAVIAWGMLALAAALGAPVPRLRPRAWNRAVVRIRRRRPAARAALVGLLSAALPCGWLWAFVLVAAGTGSLAGGAAVMATFWLGTVPMMVGLGAIAGRLVHRFGARLPFVTAATLIGLGVVALAARTPVLHAGLATSDTAGHGSAAAGGTAGHAGASVPSAPACHGGAP